MRSSKPGFRLQIVALLSMIGLLLAACGETQPAGQATQQPAGQPTQPSAAQATTPPEDQATSEPGDQATSEPDDSGTKLNPDVSGTVEFWHFWGSPVRRTAIRRVIAVCQQQLPNIQVQEVFKPWGDIWTANIAAVAAGSGMPDVIVEDRPQLPQRAIDDVDQSLQELAERDGIDGSQFWPFTWQQTLYNDETYGLPFETEVRVLYWNKLAFEEAGLDPEKPPKTWDELWEYADKLDKRGADGSYERIGFFPLFNVGPDIWGYTNDAEWITADGEPVLNSPEAVEAVEWVKQWVDRYGGWQNLQDFRASFASPPQDMFMSGSVAMYVDHNGYTSFLDFFRPRVTNAAGETVNLDWGVSDLPHAPDADKASWSGGMALSIPRGAQNVEPAWEFIKCATGPEAQASWARDTYAIPANMAGAKDPVLMADERWQFYVSAMEYSTGGNYLVEYPNWGQELNNRYERVWTGELTPQQALEEAQQAVEAEVQKKR